MSALKTSLTLFQKNHRSRFSESEIIHLRNEDGIAHHVQLTSPLVKPGNYPTIFYHGRRTKDVVILCHGLSDSPYYMKAVGRRFYNAGANVVFPLLPAHGLKEPDKAMEDHSLDNKWRNEMERTVALAEALGNRITLGGFSAGGALSYNFVLRHPEKIQGGLFLFASAIAVKLVKDVGRFIILKNITKMRDGKIHGIGRNPFKYPNFPIFGAMELGDIIRENVTLSKGRKITQPVFAAHSVHDKAVLFQGILDLLTNHCEKGTAFLVSENVAHGELPLDRDIPLDETQSRGPKYPQKANPQFDMMMDNVVRFFEEQVVKK